MMIDLRPSLTSHLAQRLGALQDGFRHNLAVLGPVGSGKSTLLHEALQISNPNLIKISCTLQRDSAREFVKRFATAVLRACLEAPSEAPLEVLLEQSAAVVPKTTAAIHQLERYTMGHVQTEAFTHALDLIPVVHEELKRPCVLVLDEFLHLEDLGSSYAFHELGKRVMTWPFTLFLVTSSSTFRARQILRERLHLLFGQFELISLGAVELPAASTWMQQEFPGVSHLTPLGRFLLHWIGAFPWYLSVLLKRMNELTRLRHSRGVTDLPASPARLSHLPGRARREAQAGAVMFPAAWDVLGSPDGVLYQWCAAQMERIVQQRQGPVARDALIAIACGARTTQAITQRCGTRRNLSSPLQLLVEHDLIQRKGGCWIIPDPLLSCWLSAVLGPRQRAGSLDRRMASQIFEQTLKAIWAQWVEEAGQPLAERIRRLLSQFRNETVSLDHKTGRLAAFEALRTQRPSLGQETYLVADGAGRRWCCLIHEGKLEEAGIMAFEQFCRAQSPKPSRKVVVAKDGLELSAKLLAKEVNMWVWEPEDVHLLFLLYGQPPLAR